MKRIIALILSLIITAGVTVFADSEAVIDYNKWGMLSAINVADADEAEEIAERTVSRGEFINWLARLIRVDKIAWTSKPLLADVSENHSCYDAANTLRSMGIYVSDELRPDDKIIYTDALEMLLRAMGYDKQLELNSVHSVASGLDLPAYAATEKISYNQLAELFYAAADEKVMQYEISGADTYIKDTGDTLLSKYYDIEIKKGIVTGNRITSLYSAEGRRDSLAVDEVWYSDRTGGDDWLGCSVRAYVDYSKDDDGEIVWIENYGRNNTVLEIAGNDIVSVNSRMTEIRYVKDNGKSTRENIDINAKLIYNGRSVSNGVPAMLAPEIGRVTLIDNNKNNVYDVVKVWSYENILVNSVHGGNLTIYNEFTSADASQSISLGENNDLLYDIYYQGEKSDFSCIREGYIVSAAKSNDGKYIRLDVSGTSKKGRLEQINTVDREITVDGEIYRLAENVQKNTAHLK